MVEIYLGKRGFNGLIANMPGVGRATYDAAKRGERLAHANLEQARATTTHHKIYGPDHLTRTDARRDHPDATFSLIAPDALAIEFGHDPSGVFAGTDTKSPDGLYILIRAALEMG